MIFNTKKILEIIKQSYEGEIVLPEFQRNFVWNNQDIKELLVSVLKGYFIGTFLLLRRNNEFGFKTRYIEGLEHLRQDLNGQNNRPDCAVLDGQQRITALFYAMYAPPNVNPKGTAHPHRYFIKLMENWNEDCWDDAVFSISENDPTRNIEVEAGRKSSFADLTREVNGFDKLVNQEYFKRYCYSNEIVPFTVLKNRPMLGNWFAGYGNYVSQQRPDSNYAEVHSIEEKKNAFFENWFEFDVPILTLENMPLPDVAEVFERINKTGVELSVFALATAVFFEGKINLRDWWLKTFNDGDSELRNGKFCKKDDENYPKYILQIMALLQGKEVKKRVLINKETFTVTQDKWQEASNQLNRALQRLQDTTTGYGVIDPKFFPYHPIIVPLAALLQEVTNENLRYNQIDRWYWSSVLTGRYEKSSDTVIKQDYDQVKSWFGNDQNIPDAINRAQQELGAIDLREVAKGGLYKALLNIIAIKRPLDFFSGQTIELIKLNDHHIFPKRAGISLGDYGDSILNRTLIDDKTNREIQNKKPSEYLKEMREKLQSDEKLREVLETHYIDDNCLKAMRNDDFDDFIKCREKLLLEVMRRKIQVPNEP